MITLIFVEGERDFYFFYHVFQQIKNFVNIDLSYGFDDYVYYYYKKLPRLVVRNNAEVIIIMHLRGKINATDVFIESLNLMLRNKNEVKKMLLIVDRDEDVNTKSKIIDTVQNLKSRFETSKFKTEKKETFENFEAMNVRNFSKMINIGIMDISPNLDYILATFIKENHVIEESALKCDYDNIIKNAMALLHLDINGLSKILADKYKEKLVEYLLRTNIKNRICKFFDISTAL